MARDFLSDLRNRLYDKIRIHDKKEYILFSPSSQGKDLSHCTVEEILPHLIVNSSMATIESKEKTWVGTSMLMRFLSSFTNNLVVMESGTPVGILGSREILQGIYNNPKNDFFTEHIVSEVMNKEFHMTSPKTKVFDLLKKMNRYGRDFALVQTTDNEYSTISARRLLEVGILCDTEVKVSDIPSKKIATFQKEDTIEFLINQMLKKNTDILVLEQTPFFVTPRTIFEKIIELNYLDGVDDFLYSKASVLHMRTGCIISDNITVPEMCKIMLSKRHTFVMTQDNVLTPWDLIITLA